MPTRKTPTPSLLDIVANTPLEPNKPTPLDRQAILETIAVSDSPASFAELVEAAQKISRQMYLNQASICLQMQKDYMNRETLLLPIENFRTLKILADLMRELNAYDVSVDQSKAWELLERCGYKITSATDAQPSDDLDNIDSIQPLESPETDYEIGDD